MMTTVTTDNN